MIASPPTHNAAGNEVPPARILSEYQRKLLVSALRTGPSGKVEVVFAHGDDEAENFANQITTALLLGGQSAELHSIPTLKRESPTVGITMQVPGGPVPGHVETVLNAFNLAHIPRESALATGAPPSVLIIKIQSRQSTE